MDSKLVVEQMSGRWKIKHPDMRPLAARARALAPAGTTYTWIPREQNKHADRILNEALDAQAAGRPAPLASRPPGVRPAQRRPSGRRPPSSAAGPRAAPPTTLVLVRHGVTGHTLDKRFSSGLGGSNPGSPTRAGRRSGPPATGWPRSPSEIDAVVASPVRRTRESAEILAERLGKALVVEPGLAEMEFGTWDGMTFAEIQRAAPRRPGRLARVARPRARRGRVLPRRGEAGAGRPRAAAGRVRRPDRPRGQPRHADQGARRARAGRAAGVGLPDGDGPGVGDGAVRTSPTGTPSLRMFNAPPDATPPFDRSLTTTSSWVPCRPAGPSSTVQPSVAQAGRRTGPAVPGRRAVLQQRAHDPALGRLVEVRDDLAGAVHLVQHAQVTTLRARSGAGRQKDAYVDERRSTTRPRPAAVAHALVQPPAPVRRHRAGPGQRHVAREPVGRDPVRRAQQAEQARGHREPGRGPPPRRAGQRPEPQRLVEHAAVDRVGARRRGAGQPRVRGDVGGLGGAEPEHPGRGGRLVRRTQGDEGVEHLGAVRLQLGERQRGQVEGLAAARGGLPLRRGQQDQHRVTLCWPTPTHARGDHLCRDES